MSLAIAAYHEAGHVVAHIVLGLGFESVAIGLPDCAGHVVPLRPPEITAMWKNNIRNPQFRSYTENELVALLAGPRAQLAKFPRSSLNDTVPLHGDLSAPVPSSDVAQATRVIANLFQHADMQICGAYIRYIDACAIALVRNNWAEIELVATTLLEHKTLTADEVNSLFGLPTVRAHANS